MLLVLSTDHLLKLNYHPVIETPTSDVYCISYWVHSTYTPSCSGLFSAEVNTSYSDIYGPNVAPAMGSLTDY